MYESSGNQTAAVESYRAERPIVCVCARQANKHRHIEHQ